MKMKENIVKHTRELSSSFVHHLIMNYGADYIYGAFLNTLINRYPDKMILLFQKFLPEKSWSSPEAVLNLSNIQKSVINEKNVINLLSSDDSLIAIINLNPWGSFVVGNGSMIYENPIFRFELPMLNYNIHFEEFRFDDILAIMNTLFSEDNQGKEDYNLIQSFFNHNVKLTEIFNNYYYMYSNLIFYNEIFSYYNEELEASLLINDFKNSALSFFIDDFEKALNNKFDSNQVLNEMSESGNLTTIKSPTSNFSKRYGFSMSYSFSLQTKYICLECNLEFSSTNIKLTIDTEINGNCKECRSILKKEFVDSKIDSNSNQVKEITIISSGRNISDGVSIEEVLDNMSLFCVNLLMGIIKKYNVDLNN